MAVTDRSRGRVVARDDQEPDDLDDVLVGDDVPIPLGPEQPADHVRRPGRRERPRARARAGGCRRRARRCNGRASPGRRRALPRPRTARRRCVFRYDHSSSGRPSHAQSTRAGSGYVSARARSPPPASMSGWIISPANARTRGSRAAIRSLAKYGCRRRRNTECTGRSTSSGGRGVPNWGAPELTNRSGRRASSTASAYRLTTQNPPWRVLHATGLRSRSSAHEAGGSATASGANGSHSAILSTGR